MHLTPALTASRSHPPAAGERCTYGAHDRQARPLSGDATAPHSQTLGRGRGSESRGQWSRAREDGPAVMAQLDRPQVTAGRLVSLAMVAGALATVVVFLVASGDREQDGSDDAGWLIGLLLVLGPFLAAALARTVISSTLLRPIGAAAAVLATVAAAVHVGLAVDAQGASGWLISAPAVAVPVLLLGAVRRGPVVPPGGVLPTRGSGTGQGVRLATDDPDGDRPSGPPLEVAGALAAARRHAGRTVLAWLAVLIVAAGATAPLLRLLGWPSVEATLDAQVASVESSGEGTAVRFEAPHQGRTLSWTVVRDESAWEEGDRFTAFLDAEDRVHFDQQGGLAGAPLILPFSFVGIFLLFALRRLWGLAVAFWDVSHGDDAPRAGYAAVIDDPAPKAWRPLLAVWSSDPTGGERLARPDAVYRADHATSEDLECAVAEVVVRRAWIDSGFWGGAKPRWVGFEDGTAVPHRRSLFGSWYVHRITRRSAVPPVVPLEHGPPRPGAHSAGSGPAPDRARDSMVLMVAWRLLALLAGIGMALITEDSGTPARLGEVVVS